MNTSPVTITGRVAPIDEFFLTAMGGPTDGTTFFPTAEQWADLDARVTRLSKESAR